MPRYKIYTVPDPTPGTRALQASAETWRAVIAELRATDRRLASELTRQLGDGDGNAVVVRVPEERAKVVLQRAGVSA